MLRGFPDFYFRHVAKAHNNQVWLVTHSDTLLRRAVGNANFSVYHMTNASSVRSGDNQALPVAEDELARAVLDLVGDAAAYRPYAKVLIFEGGGDSNFDVDVVSRLFPTLADRVNLVRGESKGKVRGPYAIMARTAAQVGLADRFYAITDRDFDSQESIPNAHVMSWGVYHIENYLLDPQFVLAALRRVAPSSPMTTEQEVTDALKEIAKTNVDGLVRQKLQEIVNDLLVKSINIDGDPAAEPVTSLLPSINASLARLEAVKSDVQQRAWLKAKADEYRQSLNASLDDGSWLQNFPARPIIRGFVHQALSGLIAYEGFINLILDSMIEAGHRPAGMISVLSRLIDNP